MSFSVNNKTESIVCEPTGNSKLDNSISNLLVAFKSLSSFLKTYPLVNKYLKIDVTSNVVEISYNVLDTTNSVIGFLGSYLDTDSGYFLLSDKKENNGVVFANLYDFLKLNGVTVDNQSLKVSLEQFKLGFLSMTDMVKSWIGGKSIDGGSLTSKLLKNFLGKRTISTDSNKESKLFIGKLMNQVIFPKFDIMSIFVGTGVTPMGVYKDGLVYSLVSQNENISDFVYDLFGGLRRETLASYNWDPRNADELCFNYSAMVGSVDSRSEALAMNMLDISDVGDKDSDLLYCMDDKDSVKSVLSEIGVTNYLKGAKMSSMIKAFTNSKVQNKIVQNLQKGIDIAHVNELDYVGDQANRVLKLVGKSLERINLILK